MWSRYIGDRADLDEGVEAKATERHDRALMAAIARMTTPTTFHARVIPSSTNPRRRRDAEREEGADIIPESSSSHRDVGDTPDRTVRSRSTNGTSECRDHTDEKYHDVIADDRRDDQSDRRI